MIKQRIFMTSLMAVLGLMILCLSQSAGGEFRAGFYPEKKVLHIGYPAGVLSRGVLQDLRISFQAWGTNIAARSSDRIDQVKAMVFDEYSEFRAALKRDEIDVMVLNSMDYIELEDLKHMEPFSVGFSDEKACQEYVLLVRRDRGIDSVSQLKNGTLIVDEGILGRMPHFWLEVLLWNEGILDKNAFFREIKTVNKTSQAVLPVFFNKTSACVTNMRGFRTISELNPQIEKQLSILNVSPEFLRGLFVFRRNLELEIKRDVSRVLQSLHEDPDGQQILILLKENRLAPFKPEYLVTVKKLYEEYHEIQLEKAKGQ